MKKLITILCILGILFAFYGCADEPKTDKADKKQTTAAESQSLDFKPTNASKDKDKEKKAINEGEKETEKDAESTSPAESDTSSETEAALNADGEVHVDGITLDKYEVNLTPGGRDMPLVTMSPANASNIGEIWTSDNNNVAVVDLYGNITAIGEGTCTVRVTSADNSAVFADVKVTVSAPAESPAGSEVSGITYIQGILIANKTYALPADYNPGEDPTAMAALYEMFAAAQADGYYLYVASGFRSYDFQNMLYNNYVAMDGKANADTYSARPGHSEHQTGLAFDLNQVADYFAYTPEGIWLADNCWKYGFIIRYPLGKEAQTGYKYEPWHVRFIGKDNAEKVYKSGLCLEEYLNITSVYAD